MNIKVFLCMAIINFIWKILVYPKELFCFTMVNEKTRRMEYLIYILTVGLLATTVITFRIMNTLAKEVANIKKKIK